MGEIIDEGETGIRPQLVTPKAGANFCTFHPSQLKEDWNPQLGEGGSGTHSEEG